MNTESTSTAVVVVEPTLASVRAAREEAVAKAKEERRVREKTYALQMLDGFVSGVSEEIDRLDAEVKRLADRRKRLEEAVSVGKSIDTNAALTAEEISEVYKKASDVYYNRKEGEKGIQVELCNSLLRADNWLQLVEPHFHRGGIVVAAPSLRGRGL